MQRITPFLWFDGNAEEAARFYVSAFKDSKVLRMNWHDENSAKASGMPAGSVLTVYFRLMGQEFGALNGGPEFRFTPAVSFFVQCRTRKALDKLYRKLSHGGKVLMPLQEYPFSRRYAWISDRFGLSWQLMLTDAPERIIPCLLFVGKQHGRAEEAMKYYVSVFGNSRIKTVARYEKGEDTPGTIKHGRFRLAGQEFIAMDSGFPHKFGFTEANSFVVNCRDQKEIDYYWSKLSKGGDKKAQQCGWLKDRYGLSWQVVPSVLEKLLDGKDPQKTGRAMAALMPMKKLDIGKLKRAYDGK